MPEAGIPTMEHPYCSAVKAVATTHHHHLSLQREGALSLLPAAQAEPEGSPRSAACTEEFLIPLRCRQQNYFKTQFYSSVLTLKGKQESKYSQKHVFSSPSKKKGLYRLKQAVTL